MYSVNASGRSSCSDADDPHVDEPAVDEPDPPESYYSEPDLEVMADRAAAAYEDAWWGHG